MNRRSFLSAIYKRLIGYGLPTVTTALYSLYIEPGWLRLHHQIIHIPSVPPMLRGLRIVQLSDLHLEPNIPLSYIQRAVQLANAQNPHLIVLTGDYADTLTGLTQLPIALSELRAPLGIYAVLGNHDIWLGDKEVQQAIAISGVTVLENRGLILEFQNTPFYLAGLSDSMSDTPDLNTALLNLPSEMFCILLAHEPDVADEVAKDGRVHLQLSGHSHGGQVRVPFFGALVLPPMGNKYPEGLSIVGNLQVYTTRGVGLIGEPFGPPVRFNCRPEVSLLVLN